jgi:hypothetical protein
VNDFNHAVSAVWIAITIIVPILKMIGAETKDDISMSIAVDVS